MKTDPADISRSIAITTAALRAEPEKALSADSGAVAMLSDGLRCRVSGPNGATLVSDMPTQMGGGGMAPTPGWMLRAALASCDASLIAMRAAQLGVTLHTLEVRVDSVSDARGMLGIDDTVPSGPLKLKVHVRIGATGCDAEALSDLVRWADAHSPVGDALRRGVAPQMEIEVI